VRFCTTLGGRSPGGGVWGANSTSLWLPVGDLESGATVADGRVPGVVRAQRRPSTSAAGQRHFHHPSSAVAERTGLNHPRSIFRRHNHVLGFISSVPGVNNSPPSLTSTHPTQPTRIAAVSGSFYPSQTGNERPSVKNHGKTARTVRGNIIFYNNI